MGRRYRFIDYKYSSVRCPPNLVDDARDIAVVVNEKDMKAAGIDRHGPTKRVWQTGGQNCEWRPETGALATARPKTPRCRFPTDPSCSRYSSLNGIA